MKTLCLILLIIGLVIAGCSTLNVQDNPILSEAIIKAGTARMLTEKPSWIDDTLRISAVALAAVEADKLISLEELEKYARAQIPWDKITPEEIVLIDMLISSIRTEIDRSVKGGEISGASAVQTSQILRWIHETAQIYANSVNKE